MARLGAHEASLWIARIARLPLVQLLGGIVGGLTSKLWRKIAYSEPSSSMTLRAGEQPGAVIAAPFSPPNPQTLIRQMRRSAQTH
jgi:hypothetical protein